MRYRFKTGGFSRLLVLASGLDLSMSTILELPDPAAAPTSAADQKGRWNVVGNELELAALTDDWRELADQVGTPMEHPDWGLACAQTLLGRGRLRVGVYQRGGKLAALAPLALLRNRGIGRLVVLGAGQLHEPSSLLFADEGALRWMAKTLVRSGRPMFLERVRTDSPVIDAITRAAQGRAVVIARPQASCPYIELDETWLDPLSHLNAGRRSDLRRARRKAEQFGTLTTEILTPSADEVPPLLEEALAIEERSWKGESGTALSRDPARARFFADFARRAAESLTLRLCFLRIGDQRVAMQVALQQQGGFWLLKVGYDAQFAACSPGLWLMHDTIAHAARENLGTYELLGKSDAWTQVWTKTERACASLRVYPYNVCGMAALALDAGAVGLAAFRRKLSRRQEPS